MTRLILMQSVDPAFNLAAEEYIFSRTDDDAVLLWQNDNAVIIGRNQNTLSEINSEAIKKYGISVVRRITGGGAVFHDLGNINYSVITSCAETSALDFRRFAGPVADLLRSLGIDAEFTGRNDLEVDGRKISGNAQHISGGRILHHGTLLFSSDLDRVNEVLAADPYKIRSKAVSSVRSRVANIQEFLPEDSKMNAAGFMAELKRLFTERYSCTPSFISDDEKLRINELAESKYRTWQWNYGDSPRYSFTKKEHLPCGTVEVSLDISEGHISHAAVYGDYFSVLPKEEFISMLTGTEHSEKALLTLFNGIDLKGYFAGTDAGELIRCFF